MKKLLLTAMLLMAVSFGFAQVPQGAKTYEKNGKTYVEIKKSSSGYQPMGVYVEYEGKSYELYSKVDNNKKSKTYGKTLYYILIPDSTKKQGFRAKRVEV